MRKSKVPTTLAIAPLAVAVSICGCMVGPNYEPPPAPVADSYRDPGDESVKRETGELAQWWTV